MESWLRRVLAREADSERELLEHFSRRHMVVAVSCVLSPDGRKLFACSKGEQRVRQWDVETGQVDFEFREPKHLPIVRAALSLDGTLLAGAYRTAEIDGVVVWDVARREVVKTLPVSKQGIVDVAFSGDGEQLAVAAQNGVWLWRGEQRVAVVTDKTAIELAFTPDGRTLLWREQDQVHRWNLETSREDAPSLPISSPLALFGDHELLHVTGRTESDGSPILQATDLRSGTSTCWTWSSIPRFVRELDLGRNVIVAGDQSACILQGREFTLWDLRAKRLQCVLPAEANPSQTFDLSPDRSQLAIGLTDGSISIWNLPIIRQQLDSLGLGWE